MKKKKWYTLAREEGRLCRMCGEPVGKSDWKSKILDKLCHECFIRESELPHDTRWRLGR